MPLIYALESPYLKAFLSKNKFIIFKTIKRTLLKMARDATPTGFLIFIPLFYLPFNFGQTFFSLPFQYFSLSSLLRIFPVDVMGMESTNSTEVGFL